MIVLGLDPGYRESALVAFDGTKICQNLMCDNETMLANLQDLKDEAASGGGPPEWILVLEQMQMFRSAFGVGVEVFDSVLWSGRFIQLWHPRRFDRIIRSKVRGHLNAIKGGDAAVRQGLIVRFGAYKEVAIGSKKKPGPLFGIKSHEWSALAVAVTWWDLFRNVPEELRPGVVAEFQDVKKADF